MGARAVGGTESRACVRERRGSGKTAGLTELHDVAMAAVRRAEKKGRKETRSSGPTRQWREGDWRVGPGSEGERER